MVLIYTISYMKCRKNHKKMHHHLTIFQYVFLTASRINYTALAEIHAEFGEECYVCKEISKENFIKHVYSLISIIINYIISDSNTYTYFCFNICCLFVFFCFHYN